MRKDIEQLLDFSAKFEGLRRLCLDGLVVIGHSFASLCMLREDRFTL